MRTSPSVRRAIAVLLAALAVITFGASAAGAKVIDSEGGIAADFFAQASRAGLSVMQATALQAEVDQEIVEQGGTQISANEILWADGSGSTVIQAPNQKRTSSLALDGPSVDGCDYRYLCLYENYDRTGTAHNLFYCQNYDTPYAFFSYDNNQTEGTQGAFKDRDYNVVHWTEGAHSIVDSYEDSSRVWHVQPC